MLKSDQYKADGATQQGSGARLQMSDAMQRKKILWLQS